MTYSEEGDDILEQRECGPLINLKKMNTVFSVCSQLLLFRSSKNTLQLSMDDSVEADRVDGLERPALWELILHQNLEEEDLFDLSEKFKPLPQIE